MPALDQRRHDGTAIEPVDRYFCFILDAIAAILPEAIAGGAGAGAAGAAAAIAPEAAGADIALSTDVIAPAITSGATVGDVVTGAAGVGAGAAGTADLFGAGGITTGAGDLAMALSGASAAPGGGGGLSFSAGADTPTPLTTPTPTTGPVSAPTSAPVGAPMASAPVAPASAGPLSPTETGNFAGVGSNPTFSPPPGAPPIPNAPALPGAADAGTSVLGKATSGLTSGLDKAIGGATDGFLNLGDVGKIASVGGLGMALLNANRQLPGQPQLNNLAPNTSVHATAGGQIAEGQHLESYLQNGTLPPGVADGIKTAVSAAQASIRSQYAQRGMSGSSAEAQDLQAAEERGQQAGTQVAMNLLQQGSSMVTAGVGEEEAANSLSAQIYSQIMNDALSRDNALGSAIGNFASAIAGGSGNTVTLKAA